MNETIEKVLKQLFEKTGRRHDAYYREGVGVNIVVEGQPETHIMLQIGENQLQFMKATGQELDINVQ